MAKPILLSAGGALSEPLFGTLTDFVPLWNNSTQAWTAVAPSGDVSLTSAGAFTVTAVRNIPWSATAPSVGQVPTYNGSTIAWATPSGGGGGSPGGSGLTYFLNWSVSGETPVPGTFGPWKEMSLTPTTGAYQTVTVSAPSGSYANLADFVTDIGNPGATTTPPGFWDVNVYADFVGNQNDVQMVAEVSKWDGTTLTVLVTSEPVTLNNPGAPNLVTISFYLPATTLAANERIAIRLLITSIAGGSHNVTGYFEGEYYSHVHTSLGAPGGTGLVKVVNGIVQAPASLLYASDISGASGGLDGQGKLFIGQSGGSGPLVATLTGGTGVTVTNGDGTISLAIGQVVATTSDVTFKSLTLTNAAFSTSVALSITASNVLTVGSAGQTVTIPGSLTLSTALGATSGGTGQSSYASGDLLYANTTTTLARLADVATGNALISGGVGIAPAWGKIGLTTHVNGTLPATNGGTAQSTWTIGDILYASATNTLSKLAAGTAGFGLRTGGAGGTPSWAAIAYDISDRYTGIPTLNQVLLRFIAGRSFTLVSGNTVCRALVASSGATAAVFTIYRDRAGTKNAVGTITFTATNVGLVSTFNATYTGIVFNDIVTIEVTTLDSGGTLASPFMTLGGQQV